MTTIINNYLGITHPIKKEQWGEKEQNLLFGAWKITNCIQGVHLWDEVWSVDDHYLHCDACGIEVHIEKIIVPDGKDVIIDNSKQKQGEESEN
jgi:hypothetical protein